MVDWDSFRIILKIAQEGSLSGAARVLDVNQATVGRRLQRVEEELNTKLFHRMSNGLFPTEAGLAALSSAGQIEERINELTGKLRNSGESDHGRIRLSLPRNLLGVELSDHISDFCLREPKITFDVTTTNERVSFDDRNVDVVIRADNDPASGLWGFRLRQLKYCYVASSTFMQLWGPRITTDPRKVEVPLIDWSVGKGDPCTQHFRREFPNALEILTSDSLEGVLPLVEGGVGVGRVLKETLESRSDLVCVLDCEDVGAKDLWVLTHQDYRDTPRIRKFMEHMRDRFAAAKVTHLRNYVNGSHLGTGT